MSTINILVVDDETFARRQISEIVQTVSPKCLITEASSLTEAKSALFQNDFSIIFLDINLKGELGFDLVPSIPKQTKIIFVTAMDNYAIRAFEVNALDYILKPPTVERVKKALDLLKTEMPMSEVTDKFSIDDRIFVQIQNSVRFIDIKDIRYIQAEGVYTHLYTGEGKPYLVRKSMSSWGELLPTKFFMQIHRSTLINLNAVDRMVPYGKGTFKVYLIGTKEPLSVSRTYATDIKKMLIV